MSKEPRPLDNHLPLTEDQIRAVTVGELKPLSCRVLIVDYDPQWPGLFAHEADRIQAVLGRRALRIEHTGSTAVPGLVAKPVIDILLVVTDSANEAMYVPALESDGYSLRIREANWYEHRMFKRPDAEINLHVFSSGCPEIDRMLMFRNWLRSNAADRDLYAPSWPWSRRNGSMSRITPMPRPSSSRRSSQEPASIGNE